MPIGRNITSALLFTLLLSLSACPSPPRPAPALPQEKTAQRLALDASLSPVPFRRLGDDAVLVKPDVGNRKLAAFGNYLERSAAKRDQVWIAVWDDEEAWKSARVGREDDPSMLAHKRALYVKTPSDPAPIRHYTTFGKKGEVLYERDFLAYPLSDFDAE